MDKTNQNYSKLFMSGNLIVNVIINYFKYVTITVYINVK